MDQFLINNRDCETLFNCNYIAPGTTGRQSPTTAHVYVLQSASQCSYRPEPKSKSQLIRTVYRYVIPQRGCDMIVCKCVCSKQEGSLLLQLGAIQQTNRTTIKRELAEMHSLLLWLLYRCSNCFRSPGPPEGYALVRSRFGLANSCLCRFYFCTPFDRCCCCNVTLQPLQTTC